MTRDQTPMEELRPDRWIAMFVLLLAGFMNLIDVTIVNVAMPSLQRPSARRAARSSGSSRPIFSSLRSACFLSAGLATSSAVRACS